MAAMSRSLGLTRLQFARLLQSGPLYVMLTLLVVEAAFSACTTWLVIHAGRDIANDDFRLMDFGWIVIVQSTSYIVGAISWVFAEQAGFGAHGRYMLAFARANRGRTALFADKTQREAVEPFLTSETFHVFFELMYELEHALKLALGLIFNAIVLGVEIDAGLPLAYALTFVLCIALQYSLRGRVAEAYLNNQKATNKMTAHSYTAWDNILVGNRYNYRLWHAGFKQRLRHALKAQVRAIVTREGLSTAGGIISLLVVFAAIAVAGAKSGGDTATLIALAATLPRQIDLANDVHALAAGWNDLVAIWTRIGGVVDHFAPKADEQFIDRIKFRKLTLNQDDTAIKSADLREALALVHAQPTGRLNLRGSNGAGKSTLLTALKAELGPSAFYWPTTDRLSFQFADGEHPEADEGDANDEGEAKAAAPDKKPGFSSGERQIRSLQEIVAHTHAPYYLLDEWDANLDPTNRAIAQALVDTLARRARVVEISHRDGKPTA